MNRLSMALMIMIMIILKEHLPIRCEICHNSDLFDPFRNECGRCRNILLNCLVKPKFNLSVLERYADIDKGKYIKLIGYGYLLLSFIISGPIVLMCLYIFSSSTVGTCEGEFAIQPLDLLFGLILLFLANIPPIISVGVIALKRWARNLLIGLILIYTPIALLLCTDKIGVILFTMLFGFIVFSTNYLFSDSANKLFS